MSQCINTIILVVMYCIIGRTLELVQAAHDSCGNYGDDDNEQNGATTTDDNTRLLLW